MTLIEEFEEAEELPLDDADGVPYTIMFQAFPRPGGQVGGDVVRRPLYGWLAADASRSSAPGCR